MEKDHDAILSIYRTSKCPDKGRFNIVLWDEESKKEIIIKVEDAVFMQCLAGIMRRPCQYRLLDWE